uniref:Mitochondrial ATP synthase regulatory component factor B n=1 Tax=Globodera pallida TaxID=36090 RepID=A0A183C4L0_GLOPA
MDSQLCAAATSADGLGQQLVLRPANWQISPKNPEVILVQHTPMPSKEKAIEYLRHILDNAICIRRLDLNIKVSTNTVVNDILDVLSNHGKVQLEELFVRRRYVGSKFSGLTQLIRSNAKTLKQIGKIGLGEAIKSLSEEIRLERLSLINFDLVEQDERLDSEELALNSRFYIRRLAGLGCTFDHLSYTCFTGFEVTKMPALNMLRQCKVKSLRLTMQSGVAIRDPELPRPLLPMMRRIQLVGGMDVTSERLSLLFPALEEFEVEKQDLITGRQLEKRARVLSNYAPDFSGDGYNSVAAAC